MTAAKSPAKGLSLRDSHKRRTERTLREAALELFLSQGYDSTTTEEIAARAGVSVRTFFRYFATKDEVMYKGLKPWTEALAERYLAQPHSLTEIQAMCAALIECAADLNRRALKRSEAITEGSLILRGKATDRHRASVDAAARALAARRGAAEPDAACHMLADVSVRLYQLSIDRWRSDPKVALDVAIADSFALVAKYFCAAPSAFGVAARAG